MYKKSQILVAQTSVNSWSVVFGSHSILIELETILTFMLYCKKIRILVKSVPVNDRE